MKIHVVMAVWVLAAALGSLAPLRAHGGTYRGPGSGLGPGGPSGPSGPSGPGTGGGPGAGPSTGAASEAAGDLTAWQQWWALNRDAYLELRATLIAGGDTLSQSDTFFLGAGASSPREANRPSPEVVDEVVVPRLLEILAGEKSPDVATAALFALARIGAGRGSLVLPALEEHVSSANQEISETATLGIGLLADPASCSTLVALLMDRPAGRKLSGRDEVPTRTRTFAAYGLGLLGRNATNPDVRRYVVHHLVTALEADRSATHDLPVACIIALGLIPLEPIGSPGEHAPASASRADQIAFLSGWLLDAHHPDQQRIYVPVALARLAGDDPALRSGVVALCNDILAAGKAANGAGGAAMMQSAVMALGIAADGDTDAADVRARSLLRKQAGDGDRLARRLALIAVARASARPGSAAGWPSTVEDTRAFLKSELERGSTPTRPWVGLALGILERGVVQSGAPTSPAVRALLSAALEKHASPVEAGAYALGLGLFAEGDAHDPLLRVLDTTRDDQVRGHAAVALGLARITDGIEPLRGLVFDAQYQPNLLREASIGLGLLGDKTVSLALVEMLRDAQGLSAQAAIATALGYVGDARAVAPLLSLARDQSQSKGGRAYAIVALGLICDRRLLPWNTMFAADANYWLPPSTLFDPVTSTGVLDIL